MFNFSLKEGNRETVYCLKMTEEEFKVKKIIACFMLVALFLLTGQVFAEEAKVENSPEPFQLTSPAFKDKGMMSFRYHSRGDNKSPALAWSNPPEGTASFSITCIDYDPPAHGYVHWDISNIPADYRELPEGMPRVKKGKDGIIQDRPWVGPYPPNGVHNYHFVIVAKDINGKKLAAAELIGRSD